MKSPIRSQAIVSRQPATGAVVLDGDRHAGERPRVVAPDVAGLGQRALAVDVDERPELGVERLDAAHGQLDELARRDVSGADQRGKLVDGSEQQIRVGHPGSLRFICYERTPRSLIHVHRH